MLVAHLQAEVDGNLRARTSEIQQFGARLRPDIDTPLTLPETAFCEPGVYVQVVDTGGTPVAASLNLQGQALPVTPGVKEALRASVEVLETIELEGARFRLLATPIVQGGEVIGVLQAAASMQLTDSAAARFRNLLIGGSVAAAVVAVVSGLYLNRKVLDPVAAITRTAEAICRRGDLSRRITVGRGADELSALGRTFNHMLDHIEQSVTAQRRFIADASHELKTPLTVVWGNAELMSRHPTGAHCEASAQAIGREAQRMQRIVDDLLAIAELDAHPEMQTEPLDLRRLARRVADDFQALVGARSLIVTGHGDAWVNGDVDKLERVLRNLVRNAVTATPDDGRIALDLSARDGCVEVRVVDNGHGIAPDDLPHVFERSYRANKGRSRERGGTGLGLTIVRSVVEAHDGAVEVRNRPSGGAEFTLRLPATARVPRDLDVAPATQASDVLITLKRLSPPSHDTFLPLILGRRPGAEGGRRQKAGTRCVKC
ncbi:MAG: HAMP domain-containing histidine kinase [Actinobacteria bacterium]|nr:HAMP domain-containing histidine kinase [Actinomycetota bacterium]